MAIETIIRPTEDLTKSYELTATDERIIIYALGTLTASAGLDEGRQLTPLGKQALRVAKKFGVQ